MLKSATLATGASQTSDSPVNVGDGPAENRTGGRTEDGPAKPSAPYRLPDSIFDAAAFDSFLPASGIRPAFPVTGNPAGHGGNCRRGVETLSAYLDGELDSDSQAEVADHLNNCPQCADAFDALLATDRMIQREWRDAPLPSASEMRFALDSLMDALPPLPAAAPEFAPRRVHARVRWMRFATGIASVIALLGLLWSSYRLGFTQGRASLAPQFAPRRQSRMEGLRSLLKSAALSRPKSPAAFAGLPYAAANRIERTPCLSGLFPRADALQCVR